MDPTYTTMDPSGLFLTSSGLALDAPGATGVLEPILYDPATMSSPWQDPSSGVLVAMQADGSIVPVAVSSEFIDSGSGLPSGVTNLFTTGLQSFSQQLQRWLNPASALPAGTYQPAGAGLLGGMNTTTLLLLGVGAYFLLRKKR
jgi:hypothetical protein